jgi:hypothetical protein
MKKMYRTCLYIQYMLEKNVNFMQTNQCTVFQRISNILQKHS